MYAIPISYSASSILERSIAIKPSVLLDSLLVNTVSHWHHMTGAFALALYSIAEHNIILAKLNEMS